MCRRCGYKLVVFGCSPAGSQHLLNQVKSATKAKRAQVKRYTAASVRAFLTLKIIPKVLFDRQTRRSIHNALG